MSERADDDYSLMQEVFAALPAALVVVDEHGLVVRANQCAAELLDCTPLVGKRWLEVLTQALHPQNDDGNEISTRTGRRLQVTTRQLRAGQLILMTDQTETRLLQDKLAHMERLSSLGRMAASLAHQIRTPLSAAILYAANLGNANLMPTARKRFQEKLMSRLEALEAQVSDILMFARSNDVTVSELDAQSLLTATENNVTALVSKADAHLELQAPAEAIPILGNSPSLVGALSNLVANAVEAGASAIILRLAADADKVTLSVANNGPAIPEELKAKIFEPFFTSKSSGTGLGLAVVSAVAKVHQGTLTLGAWDAPFVTVFTITIPRAPADVLAPASPSTTAQPPAEAPAASTELSANPEPGLSAAPEQYAASLPPALRGRTLPPTAAGISAQAATDANSATSAAFSAYLKRQQEKNGAAAYAAALKGTGLGPLSAPSEGPESQPESVAPETPAAEPVGAGRTLPADLEAAVSPEEFEAWLAKVSGPKG